MHKEIFYSSGEKKYDVWYLGEYIHNKDGPAKIKWNKNGTKIYEIWYIKGKYSRIFNPAYIKYNIDGTILSSEYYYQGILMKDKNKIIY